MRILIAVPMSETISPGTFKSIYDLDKAGHDITFEIMKGYDCARARNEIVKLMIKGGYDYVFMVDSDIKLPEDALKRLLEWPVDVCLGCYPHKNNKDKQAELFKRGSADFVNRFTYPELDSLNESRIRVKGGGFGCALVKRQVFDQLPYPWFKYVNYDSGSVLSEDLYFCSEANKKGIEVWADTRVRCGHRTGYYQYE